MKLSMSSLDCFVKHAKGKTRIFYFGFPRFGEIDGEVLPWITLRCGLQSSLSLPNLCQMAQLEQCGGRVDLAVAESLPRKRQKQNSTGFRGVSQVRPGKFQGRASIPGQQKHVGHFNSAEEAH